MSRGTKTIESTVLRTARIDGTLSAEIDLLLVNPMTGRTKWGAFSTLVETLLRGWVDQQRVEAQESALEDDGVDAIERSVVNE